MMTPSILAMAVGDWLRAEVVGLCIEARCSCGARSTIPAFAARADDYPEEWHRDHKAAS